MDRDALGIVRQLNRAGYIAYFVGGCVRDILLDKNPKDFDIVTSARPHDVRYVFRNAQLIGRRFKLAHVNFRGGKVIEVATFRRPPSFDSLSDGVILEDNEYGTPETDAFRRDFALNALFYDPIRQEIIDYTGGLKDIEDRIIRSIGPAAVRFREDPVRMLRAVKFAARLNLKLDDEIEAAILDERDTLSKAARPRLQQELLRFLQGGEAESSFQMLRELGLLELMCPELSALMSHSTVNEHRFFQLLKGHDLLIKTATDETPSWNECTKEEQILLILLWPFVEMLIDPLAQGSFEGEVKEIPSTRNLKLMLTRLLAPMAARVGISIKALHTLSRGLAHLILFEWSCPALVTQFQDDPQRARAEASTCLGKRDLLWAILLLLRSREQVGLLAESAWPLLANEWEHEKDRVQSQRVPSMYAPRDFMPSKPVIKPKVRRQRRVK